MDSLLLCLVNRIMKCGRPAGRLIAGGGRGEPAGLSCCGRPHARDMQDDPFPYSCPWPDALYGDRDQEAGGIYQGVCAPVRMRCVHRRHDGADPSLYARRRGLLRRRCGAGVCRVHGVLETAGASARARGRPDPGEPVYGAGGSRIHGACGYRQRAPGLS